MTFTETIIGLLSENKVPDTTESALNETINDEIVTHLIHTLTTQTSDIKYEVESKLLENHEIVSSTYQDLSVSKAQIDEILTEYNKIRYDIFDDYGVKALFKQQIDAHQKTLEELALLEENAVILDILDKINDNSESFAKLVRGKDYQEAVHSLQVMEKLYKKLQLLTSAYDFIDDRLKEMTITIHDYISNSLEDILVFDTHQLTILPSHAAMDCLQELSDVEKRKLLAPFCRSLLKNILLPLINDTSLAVSHPTDTTLILIPASEDDEENKNSCPIESLFKTLHEIFLFTTSVTPLKTSIHKAIGRQIYPELTQNIIQIVLNKNIPYKLELLDEFQNRIKGVVGTFEDFLCTCGFVDSTQVVLTKFCENLYDTFMTLKRQRILESVRKLSLKDEIGFVYIDTETPESLSKLLSKLSQDSNNDSNDLEESLLPDNLFRFPVCAVTTKAVEFIKLIDSNVVEILQSPSLSTPLIETIKKSFELYHVCHKPPKATLTNACLLHNDYMYIAHYIQIIGCRFNIKQEGSGFVLLDLLAFFRREGERCLNVELDKINDSLVTVILGPCIEGDFDVSTDEGFEAIDLAFNLLRGRLEECSRTLLTVLPLNVYCILIGNFSNTILSAVLNSVMKKIDISATDSHKLHNLLMKLVDLVEDLFSTSYIVTTHPPNEKQLNQVLVDWVTNQGSAVSATDSSSSKNPLVDVHVRLYRKFFEYAELVELNLSQISERLRRGNWYLEFSQHELQRCIRSLFSDNEKRDKLLREIEGLEI